MDIVFASSNPGKILELQTLLQAAALTIIPQAALGISEIPETGLTFVENALLKARHACQQTGLPAIADDSGLQVTALQGAPGIFSARFAGENATAQNNIKKLLTALIDVPLEKRQARFYCVLVYLTHTEDPTPLICEGTWQGHILSDALGEGGFGYDPVFWDPGENKSAAQLLPQQKNRLSHRGQALKLLRERLFTHL
jgi:XTP/dITP diphosphohydrolase